MVSQQQNPLQQQTSPSDNNSEEDTKPFSIRQYVFAIRQKGIFHNWPFSEKYLHVFLKHGISNVLPPLEPHVSALQLISKGVGLSCSQEDKEKTASFGNNVKSECNFYLDEAMSKVIREDCSKSLLDNSYKCEENNNLSSDVASNVIILMNQPSTTMSTSHLHVDRSFETMATPKKFRHKQKKRKGQCKKRSMADILAVAKYCTLEDIYRISRFSCRSIKPSEDGVEGSEIMAHVEHNCKSEPTEGYSDKKFQKDDGEAANENLLGKKRRVLKMKFGGCISKSWSID